MLSKWAECRETSPFLYLRNSIGVSMGKRTKELMRRKLFQGLRGGFSNSPNQWAEGRLLQSIRNGLRGGFSNSIAQRAEGRLLQLVVNVGRHNTAILIELFWNSQAQSSYEIEWVDSVRRKPKIQMGRNCRTRLRAQIL